MSAPAASEAALVKEALDYIKDLPDGHAVKVHGSQFGAAGEPDIDACVAGRAVHLEAKRPGNKPTPIQYAAMRRWERAGALVGWFTSIDQLRELLTHVGDLAWRNPQLCAHPDRVGGDCMRCGAHV